MSVIHTPSAKTNTVKPASGNKLLLQDNGGEEDVFREEKELLAELGRPFIESTEHAAFAFKVLTELWAESLNGNQRSTGDNWRNEMSGFLVFGQHLLDACGEGGSTLLEEYQNADQLTYPIPTWMGEFLGLKIGKSKLVSLLKKITRDSGSIGLELVDMLKIVQSANAEEGVFEDFS